MRVRSGQESAIACNRRKLPADAMIPSSKWLQHLHCTKRSAVQVWITMSLGMVEASSGTTCETADK